MAKKSQDHTARIPASDALIARVKAIQADAQQAHQQIAAAAQARIGELAGLSKAEGKIPDDFLFHLQDYAWVTRNGNATDA